MNALNNIIWYTNELFNNFNLFQSRIDPIFIPDTPQNLILQIQDNENVISNAEELINSLKRTGTFNVFTYLDHVYLDKNYNFSLTSKSLTGVRYITDGKITYYITTSLKNTRDLSPIDINQLHKNFIELPESDKILSKYNDYLRYIKWQNDGIDEKNEFPKGGLYRLIDGLLYPDQYNGKIIYVDIPESP